MAKSKQTKSRTSTRKPKKRDVAFETADLLKMISVLNEVVLEVDKNLVVTRMLSQKPISIISSGQDSVGRPLKEVWEDDSIQVLREIIPETQKDFSARTFEFQPESESNRWYGMKIISFLSHSGEPKTWVFIRDVTARKSSDLDLESQKANAYNSARLASLGELAAGIGHEINNPLSIISAKAQQLRNQAEKGTLQLPFVSESASIINETAKRIAKIVKALRSLSRDSQSDPMVDSPILEIVDETLEVCTMKFRYHGIDMRLKNNAPDAMIHCRTTAIAQVLANLLNNAYDAVFELEEKWISVEINLNGEFVELSVTDSGKGISDEVYNKIMQPFFTTKEPGKGTGLGLSISKSIVESHGGTISVDRNCPNTRFVLLLPIAASMSIAS